MNTNKNWSIAGITQLKNELTDDQLKEKQKALQETNEALKKTIQDCTKKDSNVSNDIKMQMEKIDQEERQLMKKFKPLKKIVSV